MRKRRLYKSIRKLKSRVEAQDKYLNMMIELLNKFCKTNYVIQYKVFYLLESNSLFSLPKTCLLHF